jgi:hypothetical protein
LAFARHQFELSKPQEDGSPLAAHLDIIWKRTGKVPEMIANAPKLPVGCTQLWGDFLELHGSRGSTGLGSARITFVDLKAWQEIRGTQLQPWEVDCIRKADDLWLSEFAPKPKTDK